MDTSESYRYQTVDQAFAFPCIFVVILIISLCCVAETNLAAATQDERGPLGPAPATSAQILPPEHLEDAIPQGHHEEEIVPPPLPPPPKKLYPLLKRRLCPLPFPPPQQKFHRLLKRTLCPNLSQLIKGHRHQ